MKIYIADSVKNIERTREVKKLLEAEGFEITSRWIDKNYDPNGTGDPVLDTEVCLKSATQDINNMLEAHVVLMFPLPHSSPGKNFELGFVTGFNFQMGSSPIIPIITVGELNSIFQHMAQRNCKDLEEAIEWLKSFRQVWNY